MSDIVMKTNIELNKYCLILKLDTYEDKLLIF
jgi:hypothetical protein